MRILIVTQYFWPENFRINDLALALRERGHEVVVLTGMPNYPGGRRFEGYGWFSPAQECWNGIDIIRCPLVPRGGGGGLRLAINYLSFALSATLIAPWKCKGRFDAMFVHEPSPITVALPAIRLRKLRSIPLLLWVLDLWPESVSAAGSVKSPLLLTAVGALVRFIYRRCDRVLVQSRGFVDRVIAQGASEDKVRYFPSWAESLFELPPAAAAPTKLPSLPEGFRILFAGNIGAAQDLPSIIEAADRLRCRNDIHWIIVGNGRMAQWLETEIARRRLQPTVHALGRYPLQEMPSLFARADALLVSLKHDPIFALTIPGKVQSYLASGRPILGMLDGEGARIIREAGCGFTAPAGDAGQLAESVLAMTRLSKEQLETMGQLGRAYYDRHFERKSLIDRLEQWLQECQSAVVVRKKSS